MFKKSIGLLLIMVLLVGVFTGCSSSQSSSGGENGEKKLPHITIVTAPMGSGWHSVSVLLGDIWMNNVEGLNVSVLEGGSVGNIKAISKGLDANVGWAYTTDLRDANLGEGAFDKVYGDALPIGVMYPVWLNVVTLADSDIKSIEDLKSAKVNAGAIGTGSELAARRLLEAYGLSYDIIKENGGTVSYGNYSDASTQLKDGIVDVMLGGGAPDIPALHEVETQKSIRLLPASEEALENLDSKGYGYSVSLPIPANTYKDQADDIPAVAYQSVMIANKDVPEEVVYKLVKYLWENIEKIREEQPKRGKLMKLETVLEGIDVNTLHPGATKYYKEIGVLE